MNLNRDATLKNSRVRTIGVFLLKSALAALLLFWLVRSGRLDFAAFSALKPSAALAGMILFQIAMRICLAARWHRLANGLRLPLSWKQSGRISLIGFFAAIWTPASLGLDGARLLAARRLYPARGGAALASVLWDRVLGVWALLALCAVSSFVLWQFPLAPALRQFAWLAGGACGGAAAAGAAFRLHPAFLRVLPARWREVLASHFRVALARPLALSFATHGCNMLATWCALRALGFNAPIGSTLAAMPLIIFSSLVPLTPLGLGVTDAAAATLLHAVGVAGGAEATMLARSSFVLLSALCGLAWLWPEERRE
jgi:uncharacterized membrane protein YbhN (UPF0104 family)